MKLFEEKLVKIDGLDYPIIKTNFLVEKNIFQLAKKQAKLKSKYTMSLNQAGSRRSPELIYQRQLQGSLAEICAKLLLEFYLRIELKNVKVIRWDDIRTNGFQSPEDEFDIKIIRDDNILFVEVRSSISYKTTLPDAIKTLDIIGPYVSVFKKYEKKNDDYIRPLYQYKTLCRRIESLKNEEYLLNGQMELYFVGGATYNLFKNKGYYGTMGQGLTKYRLIKIIDAWDILKFIENIKKELSKC